MLKPNPSRDREMRKLQLELTPVQMHNLEQLMEVCGLSTRKELFNNAMTLLSWAVDETQHGRRIASYDERNDQLERILLPALDHVLKREAALEEAASASKGGRRKLRLAESST